MSSGSTSGISSRTNLRIAAMKSLLLWYADVRMYKTT